MLIPSLVQPECGQMYGYLTLILASVCLTELKGKKYFSRTGKGFTYLGIMDTPIISHLYEANYRKLIRHIKSVKTFPYIFFIRKNRNSEDECTVYLQSLPMQFIVGHWMKKIIEVLVAKQNNPD